MFRFCVRLADALNPAVSQLLRRLTLERIERSMYRFTSSMVFTLCGASSLETKRRPALSDAFSPSVWRCTPSKVHSVD